MNILILEDDPDMAERTAANMASWDRAGNVSVKTRVQDALIFLKTSKVDLLIADLRLPDGHGSEAIRLFKFLNPSGYAIVLSGLATASDVVKAIRAGASGYLLKYDDAISIRDGVEDIMNGQSPISAPIARHIIDAIQTDTREDACPEQALTIPSEKAPKLTPREKEILTAISRGFPYNQIAEIYGISPKTVPVHVRNIYRKLSCSNRAEAVFEARLHGLI